MSHKSWSAQSKAIPRLPMNCWRWFTKNFDGWPRTGWPTKPPGHTLQPTALVHEAWLRLVGNNGQAQFQNRAHFFAAAAEAMRRILIDHARRKRAVASWWRSGTARHQRN